MALSKQKKNHWFWWEFLQKQHFLLLYSLPFIWIRKTLPRYHFHEKKNVAIKRKSVKHIVPLKERKTYSDPFNWCLRENKTFYSIKAVKVLQNKNLFSFFILPSFLAIPHQSDKDTLFHLPTHLLPFRYWEIV